MTQHGNDKSYSSLGQRQAEVEAHAYTENKLLTKIGYAILKSGYDSHELLNSLRLS